MVDNLGEIGAKKLLLFGLLRRTACIAAIVARYRAEVGKIDAQLRAKKTACTDGRGASLAPPAA
ncbi:MAG: hypothetical protein L0H65_19045 [Pseudorhodobacter sp.]|nr:hypothetical protein [Pseudorhodobacter sp.]